MKATIVKYWNDKSYGELQIKHNTGYEKILSRFLKKFKKKEGWNYTSFIIDLEEPTDELVES